MKRSFVVLLIAAILAVAAVPAFAQDYALDRRAVVSCANFADAPYLYYNATDQKFHCAASMPVVYNGATLTVTAAELNKLAGVTAGTLTASKGVVVDSSKQIDYWDIKTTFKIGGTSVTATAAELNRAAGITPGTATASKLLAVDANADVTAGLRNVVASGDVKAATFHVGSDAGVDKTCTAADAILTIKKGIVTAVTCTTAGPLPSAAELMADVAALRSELAALRAQIQALSGPPR